MRPWTIPVLTTSFVLSCTAVLIIIAPHTSS